MANLSDSFGTIKVEKVGKEFLEFLNIVQGKDSDAYYTLVDREDFNGVEPDKDGNLTFDFSTFGRWNYGNNIEGYLRGDWMVNTDSDKKAHTKLHKAIIDKDGSVIIEYTDSDGSTDWIGTGVAELASREGEIYFNNCFNDEIMSIKRYAELYGYDDEIEVMESLHGDEAADAYVKYIEGWKKDHEFISGSSEPACADEWYDNEYEQE